MCASIRTAHNIFKSGKCLLIGWKVPWLGWITAWLQTLWWTAARHPVCWRHSWYVMLLTSLVLCNVRTNTIAFVSDCLGEMWYCKAVFFKFLPFSWSKCVNEYEYLTFTKIIWRKKLVSLKGINHFLCCSYSILLIFECDECTFLCIFIFNSVFSIKDKNM